MGDQNYIETYHFYDYSIYLAFKQIGFYVYEIHKDKKFLLKIELITNYKYYYFNLKVDKYYTCMTVKCCPTYDLKKECRDTFIFNNGILTSEEYKEYFTTLFEIHNDKFISL